MGLKDISTSIQLPDQTSSRFINRFIRLKTTYWNRGFAIVMLTFIGSLILHFQLHSLLLSLWKYYKESYVDYFNYGMCIGFIPGGVLATVFPAHKVFGISFIVSSTYNFMEVVNTWFFLNADWHHLFQFCTGTTMAIAYSATHRVCTLWIPLNKQSLRYVPIVLWTMAMLYTQLYMIEINDFLQERTRLFVKVGSAWFVLWFFVVSGDRSQSPNRCFVLFRDCSNTAPRPFGISLRRSILSDIPWKSFCTSMPVIAIFLSHMCYANVHVLKDDYYKYYMELDQPLRKHTTIFLLLLFVLVELVPEITACLSVTNARKLFSCTIFIAMGIIFFLEAFEVKTVLFLETNKLVNDILSEIEYLIIFGFNINHLDIAPKYASVLYGFQLTIQHISGLYWTTFVKMLISSEMINYFEIRVLMAVICLAVAVFYSIFASAEIQPWAEDKPAKENQLTMHEEGVLSAV